MYHTLNEPSKSSSFRKSPRKFAHSQSALQSEPSSFLNVKIDELRDSNSKLAKDKNEIQKLIIKQRDINRKKLSQLKMFQQEEENAKTQTLTQLNLIMSQNENSSNSTESDSKNSYSPIKSLRYDERSLDDKNDPFVAAHSALAGRISVLDQNKKDLNEQIDLTKEIIELVKSKRDIRKAASQKQNEVRRTPTKTYQIESSDNEDDDKEISFYVKKIEGIIKKKEKEVEKLQQKVNDIMHLSEISTDYGSEPTSELDSSSTSNSDSAEEFYQEVMNYAAPQTSHLLSTRSFQLSLNSPASTHSRQRNTKQRQELLEKTKDCKISKKVSFSILPDEPKNYGLLSFDDIEKQLVDLSTQIEQKRREKEKLEEINREKDDEIKKAIFEVDQLQKKLEQNLEEAEQQDMQNDTTIFHITNAKLELAKAQMMRDDTKNNLDELLLKKSNLELMLKELEYLPDSRAQQVIDRINAYKQKCDQFQEKIYKTSCSINEYRTKLKNMREMFSIYNETKIRTESAKLEFLRMYHLKHDNFSSNRIFDYSRQNSKAAFTLIDNIINKMNRLCRYNEEITFMSLYQALLYSQKKT